MDRYAAATVIFLFFRQFVGDARVLPTPASLPRKSAERGRSDQGDPGGWISIDRNKDYEGCRGESLFFALVPSGKAGALPAMLKVGS